MNVLSIYQFTPLAFARKRGGFCPLWLSAFVVCDAIEPSVAEFDIFLITPQFRDGSEENVPLWFATFVVRDAIDPSVVEFDIFLITPQQRPQLCSHQFRPDPQPLQQTLWNLHP